MARIKLMIFGAFCIATLHSFGFEHPLPPRERYVIKEKVYQDKITDIEKFFADPGVSKEKKRIALQYLGYRKDPEVLPFLLKIAEQTRYENLAQIEPSAAMLHAAAVVAALQNQYSDSPKNYLANLEVLLDSGDSFIVDAAAVELGRISSSQARNLLKKCENLSTAIPIIKMERLRIDFWPLSATEFTKAILASASEAALHGDCKLVAEGSILGDRLRYAPLDLTVFEAELNSETGMDTYLDFLKDERNRLFPLIEMYYPGYPNALSPECSLESLEEIWRDETKMNSYRELAYAEWLRRNMSQSQIPDGTASIEYLLSQLRSLGDGDYRDYQKEKPGIKTVDAIRDGAIVRLLLQKGKEALPPITNTIMQDPGERDRRRTEALIHIKEILSSSVWDVSN